MESIKKQMKDLKAKCSNLASHGYECFNLLYDDIAEDIPGATPSVYKYWKSEFDAMCKEFRVNAKISD